MDRRSPEPPALEQVLQELASPEPDPRTGCQRLEPAQRGYLALLELPEREPPESRQTDRCPESGRVSLEPASPEPDRRTDCRHLEPEWRGWLGSLDRARPESLQTDRWPEQEQVSRGLPEPELSRQMDHPRARSSEVLALVLREVPERALARREPQALPPREPVSRVWKSRAYRWHQTHRRLDAAKERRELVPESWASLRQECLRRSERQRDRSLREPAYRS